jgi:hypothetical protein
MNDGLLVSARLKAVIWRCVDEIVGEFGQTDGGAIALAACATLSHLVVNRVFPAEAREAASLAVAAKIVEQRGGELSIVLQDEDGSTCP